MNVKSKIGAKIDWFFLSLGGAVLVSFIFPWLGANGGPFYLEYVTKWGVFVIFLLHGAKLSMAQIRAGLSAWRIHIASQAIVFIVFPMVGLFLYFATNNILSDGARLGILFLCAVSSTISSSVVLTSMAGGNTAGTVFSATISGILGIFITPILISIIYATNQKLDTIGAIVEIMKLLLLPFILGQVFRPFIGRILETYKSIVSLVDRIIIVLIVFVAFCNTNQAQLFTQTPLSTLFILAIIVCLLLAFAITISKYLGLIAHLDRADTLSVVFVGATKSLANGVPIASVLFANDNRLGFILLPLMLYHPLQLTVCTWLARKWQNQISRDL